jgi:antitoxin MazE
MKVEKWDNELAIRLSPEVLDLMGLKEGDDIDIRVAGTDAFDIERTQGNERIRVRLRKVIRLGANARSSEDGD